MLDLRIDRLQLNVEDAAGHEHRLEPIAARAAALLAERLAEQATAGGQPPTARAVGVLSAAPVGLDLSRMGDEQAADAIAGAWLAVLATELGISRQALGEARRTSAMAALKGAFINLGAGLLGALPNIVVFQFNPDRVTRTPSLAQPPPPTDGAGSRDASQQPGQPTESYSFTLRVDATDQLAGSNPIAAASGILPTLSALELLMVPKGSLSIDLFNLAGSKDKPFQLPPERLPTVLFFWGPFRILPVNIASLSITETQYDQLLNPLRAEVTVNVRVLTPSQLAKDATLARGAYTYSQGVKEVMAALNLANAVEIGVSASLSLSF